MFVFSHFRTFSDNLKLKKIISDVFRFFPSSKNQFRRFSLFSEFKKSIPTFFAFFRVQKINSDVFRFFPSSKNQFRRFSLFSEFKKSIPTFRIFPSSKNQFRRFSLFSEFKKSIPTFRIFLSSKNQFLVVWLLSTPSSGHQVVFHLVICLSGQILFLMLHTHVQK